MVIVRSAGSPSVIKLLSVVCLLSSTAWASSSFLSYTGTLSSSENDAELTFTLSSPDTVTFQTWGFGGGTNAAGQAIPPGGFDPLIALFTGSGPTANVFLDGSGNPLADADTSLLLRRKLPARRDRRDGRHRDKQRLWR